MPGGGDHQSSTTAAATCNELLLLPSSCWQNALSAKIGSNKV